MTSSERTLKVLMAERHRREVAEKRITTLETALWAIRSNPSCSPIIHEIATEALGAGE